MICDGILKSDRIYFRTLDENDVSDRYVNWLADPEVNDFLETRWKKHSPENILTFVQKANASKNSYLFGIFLNDNDLHIGNIKVASIDLNRKCADVSFFIGDKNKWAKGFATEALRLALKFSFEELKLNRVQAGYISGNEASAKIFERNRFVVEGHRRKHNRYGDSYLDTILVGLLRDEWSQI